MTSTTLHFYKYRWHLLSLALMLYAMLWALSFSTTSDVKLTRLVPANQPSMIRPVTLPFAEHSSIAQGARIYTYKINGKIYLPSLTTADTVVITVDDAPDHIVINGEIPDADPSIFRNYNYQNQILVPLKWSYLHEGENNFEIIFHDVGNEYAASISTKSVWLKKSLIVVVPALFLLLMSAALRRSHSTFTSRGNKAAALLLLIGVCAIALTYSTLSQTYDEPAHIAAGMQWWDKDQYSYDTMHVPLARIASSALLYLFDITPDGDYHDTFVAIGNRLLNNDDAYIRNLTLARMGILPFYLLAGSVVYLWSRRLYGNKTALFSLTLYVLSPMLIGHAGLATTDFAYTAMSITALFAFILWLDSPTIVMSVFFGVSTALMLLCKISGLVQFFVAVALMAEWHAYDAKTAKTIPLPYRAYSRELLLIALPCAALVIDACYGFDHFQGFMSAIQLAAEKNNAGQAIWLFGPLNDQAVWYYFPVAFLFKNPLPFLVLSAVGMRCNLRRHTGLLYQHRAHFPLIAAFGIILASTISHLNIGSRHVLPSFMLLTIPAGYGLNRLLASPQRKLQWLAYGLAAWQAIAFIRIAPDYFTYVNELAITQEPI